jgi:DNA-binding GntR family transcriptional regulator
VGTLLRQVRRDTLVTRELREQALGWHTRILDAVRAGSREAARAAMEGHMDATFAVLEDVIRERGLHLSPQLLDGHAAVR